MILAVWICPRHASTGKVKVLNLIRKENKSYAEVAKIYSKNKSVHEIMRKKKIHASFAAVPQTAKVMAIVHDIYLVKMKKALNLCNKIF